MKVRPVAPGTQDFLALAQLPLGHTEETPVCSNFRLSCHQVIFLLCLCSIMGGCCPLNFLV